MKQEILRMNNVISQDSTKTNLSNFNMHMFRGEITGLICINEHGKDKLIELICANTPIKFGSVYFMEKLVNSYKHSGETQNKVYVLGSVSRLVQDLTVIDNVFVLRKGFGKYIVNKKILSQQFYRLQKDFGTKIDPRALCGNLNEYERCLVELLKAVVIGVKLIIVNDISNSLSVSDLQALHKILFGLAKNKHSILYIGNHHEEVFPICSRVMLMQDGKIVKDFEHDELNDKNILPYTISFEETQKERIPIAVSHKISFEDISFDAAPGDCIVLYDKSSKVRKNTIDIFEGQRMLKNGQMAVIEENALETMLYHHLSYIDNLCFLLDNKPQRINLTKRVKKSIIKEYYVILGEEMYAADLRKLEKTSLYNIIYYRVHLLNPKIVFLVQPFSNADMYVRRHIIHLIRVLKRKGIIVIILAVSISDTLYVADKFILIEDGKKKHEYLPDSFQDISYYI